MGIKAPSLLTLYRKLSILIILLIGIHNSYSQEYIDSLEKAYSQKVKPFEKANIQELIGMYYTSNFEYQNAADAFKLALSFITNDDLLYKAKIFEKLGNAYMRLEHMDKATIALQKALFFSDLGKAENSKIAQLNLHIGRTFYDVAQYDSAMTYYIVAQKIFEENKIYNEDYGSLFHFIGSVFKRQDDMDKACIYYNKQIEYGKRFGFKGIEAEGLYLAASCLDSDSAMLISDLRSAQLYKEIGNTSSLGLMYSLIGSNYNSLEIYDSALFYQKKSLQIFRDRNDLSQTTGILIDISRTLISMERYNDAKPYLREAEEYIEKTGIKKLLRMEHIHEIYFNLYYDQQNYKEAVDALQLMHLYRDSTRYMNQENAIQEMALKYETEKTDIKLSLLEKDKNLAEQEKLLAEDSATSEAIFSKIMMASGVLLLIAGGFVFVKYRESQRQKIIIEEQKKETLKQKEIVEAKNKDITDSIIYASSIQKAIITSRPYISKMFKGSFVLNKPKDIVSGDFYWAFEVGSKKFIALGDCTGHGVPGAMMSILGNTFLNQIIVEGKIYEPDQIMNKLREQVKHALSNNISKDGMDMSLCCIEGSTVKFCGANLPIYVISDNELTIYKGNKQPVGLQPGIEKPFVQQTFTAKAGTRIFLFSDGFADQFGGPNGKKYKYQTFRDKLLSLTNISMAKHETRLNSEFEIWKDDLEQVDDVCVMGVVV
ncbi:SpoIIE family protein phosphatase [Crocinitomix sp.]|nr:SpoIIE family protein phosphatase [Crocinitomix sp.]